LTWVSKNQTIFGFSQTICGWMIFGYLENLSLILALLTYPPNALKLFDKLYCFSSLTN
jgi:hypothetical protein